MTGETLNLLEVVMIALRGGAAAISLALAWQFIAIRPNRPVTAFGAAFLVGAALYALVTIEPVRAALGNAVIPLKLTAILAPGFLWLFILALYDDEFRWRNWMAAPLVAMGALFLSCIPFPALEPTSKLVQLVICLGLMAHMAWIARASCETDLVTSRRHFTKTMNWLVAFMIFAIVGIEIFEILDMRGQAIPELMVSGVLFIVSLALMVSLSSIRRSLIPAGEKHARASGAPHAEISAADRIDLGRLRDLMDEGAYLNPGLTIGELARQLNLPEHRLRKLVNSALGYRNFAAFLNDHRISEAKRRLSDPNLVREQITGLAYDLGYQSLAPFNRAFRERAGMSPTEYRETVFAPTDTRQ